MSKANRRRREAAQRAKERSQREHPHGCHALCPTCNGFTPAIQGVFYNQCDRCKREKAQEAAEFLAKHPEVT